MACRSGAAGLREVTVYCDPATHSRLCRRPDPRQRVPRLSRPRRRETPQPSLPGAHQGTAQGRLTHPPGRMRRSALERTIAKASAALMARDGVRLDRCVVFQMVGTSGGRGALSSLRVRCPTRGPALGTGRGGHARDGGRMAAPAGVGSGSAPEPATPEPGAAEPGALEPDATEPVAIEPVATEPLALEAAVPEQSPPAPGESVAAEVHAGERRGVSGLVVAGVILVLVAVATAAGVLVVATHGSRHKTVVTYRPAPGYSACGRATASIRRRTDCRSRSCPVPRRTRRKCSRRSA